MANNQKVEKVWKGEIKNIKKNGDFIGLKPLLNQISLKVVE